MQACIFCQIASHLAPAKIVYEDDQLVAFHDIRPQAPVHVLICPRKHISTLNDLTPGDQPLLGALFGTATKLAEQFGVHQRGYRTVFNVNAEAGQTVFHLHLHLIGGRVLSWP
jgi:histidine triad (HIT) family protein